MRDAFQTTRWSRVIAARGEGDEASDALAWLCRNYWYPAYAFVRRRGFSAEDAEDLTQSYFSALMEKRYLDDIDPARGRFRAFLLASLKHFTAKEWQRRHARKRHGDLPQHRVALDDGEARYRAELSTTATPEELFERRWALQVLERSLARLEREFDRTGKADRFAVLRGFLTGAGDSSQKEAARRLGLAEGTFMVQLHRARKRLGALLREEVAQTVADERAVDEEVRYLLGVVSS